MKTLWTPTVRNAARAMEAHVRDEWPRYTEEPVTDLPVHPLAPKLNVEQEPGCEIDVHFENEFSDLGQH